MLSYHFQFRHVYLYFGEQTKPAITDFFKRNIKSHAALEVKTRKGWMAIGTNANWLSIDRNEQLLTYYDLREELNATKGQPELKKAANFGIAFWQAAGYNYRMIYGIYSRNGDFLKVVLQMDQNRFLRGSVIFYRITI